MPATFLIAATVNAVSNTLLTRSGGIKKKRSMKKKNRKKVALVVAMKKFNTKETGPYALQKIIDLGVGGVISLNCCGYCFFPAHSADAQKGQRARRAATWSLPAAKNSFSCTK